MKKILKVYKFTILFLGIISILLFLLNIDSKIKADRVELFNQRKVLYDEDEFQQAIENRFIKLKDDLLEEGIVLDNIIIDDNNIKFQISKSMYLDQLNSFIDFLYNRHYITINDLSIIKNNFDYNLIMSAEI